MHPDRNLFERGLRNACFSYTSTVNRFSVASPILMADSLSKPLPDYQRPPVIEVIYGIQFEALKEWRTPLIGTLWQAIKADYPKFKEMPVLAPVIERFDQAIPTEMAALELLDGPPLPRLFFLDSPENWVMQVQNDRFLHNWKRMKEDDVYPRFGRVSERFFEAWEKFLAFLLSQEIAEPNITQLEITYINHIPVEKNRSTVEEIQTDLVDVRWEDGHKFLPSPETVTWTYSFLLPENGGRLHIALRPAQRRKDKVSVLLLELTARGIPNSTDMASIQSWFAMSREWIVRGFADITRQEVQRERWGRRE